MIPRHGLQRVLCLFLGPSYECWAPGELEDESGSLCLSAGNDDTIEASAAITFMSENSTAPNTVVKL